MRYIRRRSGGTLTAPAVVFTGHDLSAEGAADWTGESSVTLADGTVLNLENGASMSTFGPDGTGLAFDQGANTDRTVAAQADEIELRTSRVGFGALNDDLGSFAVGFRLTAAATGGYVSAFLRDAGLSAPNPEMTRIRIGDIGANDWQAQDLSGGSATDHADGVLSGIVQAALVIDGATARFYYSTGTTLPDAAKVLEFLEGSASGWSLAATVTFNANVRAANAQAGVGWGAGVNAGKMDYLWTALRQAGVS